MDSITLTPAMLDGIQRELEEIGKDKTRDIRIQPHNGSTVLVTFDAGWGTSSIVANRNGRTWQAGMGESA